MGKKKKTLSTFEVRKHLEKAIEKIGGEIGDCGSFLDGSGCDFDFILDDKIYHLEIEKTKHNLNSYFRES